jgi:purine nucleosidase
VPIVIGGDLSAVVMDCDPGWDDALALILLFASTGPADLMGVTTVYGNGTLQQSTDNARCLTAYCARPALDVYAGCDRSMPPQGKPRPSLAKPSSIPQDLPVTPAPLSPKHAVEFIASSAQRHGRFLTILATGPLTNIATAIQRSPADMRRIGGLVVVGGALTAGRTDEFNFYSDLTAAELTIKAELNNTVLIPLETCEQVKNTPGFLAALRAKGKRYPKLFADLVDEQLQQGNPGAADGLYDGVGALYLLNPALFKLNRYNVRIDSEGIIVHLPQGEPGSSVLVAESIDVGGAYMQLCSSLSE